MVAKLRYLFVQYYYLLFILVGLSQMLRISGGWTIISYLSFLLALTAFRSTKCQFCDFLVLFFIAYSLLTYPLFGDYPSDIYVASIRDQIFPMSFYFLARNDKTRNTDILQKAIYPLMAAYIIGFYLFFTSPSWYVDYKLDGNYNRTLSNYYNLTRMSSFWSSSYFVGYSAVFVIIYLINKSVFENKKINYYGVILVISFLALFFSQQRVSIAFVGIYLSVVCFVLLKKRKISPRKFILYFIALLLVITLIAVLINHYMDKYYIDYLVQHFTDSEDSIVEDRINMFKDYVSSITFFGEGLGKYSHNAIFYNMACISDCEYIRTPNEIGIFGMGIFLMISFFPLFINYKQGRQFNYESFFVIFFLLAMVGATPLEVSQQQPFMLWYCLGKMQNKR